MEILKLRHVILIIGSSMLLLTQVYTYPLTREKFNEAVFKASENVPDPDIYDYFKEATCLFFKQDLAMFLAQMIYESDGFRNIEDLRKHETDYHEEGIGVANKSYHGRGYLMLTWAGNYQAASEDIWKNSTILLNDPDLLAKDKAIAMTVSVWYWTKLVRPVIIAKSPCLIHFGYSTKVISNMRGSYECKPNDITGNRRADYRYQIYRIIARELGIVKHAYKRGCYDVQD